MNTASNEELVKTVGAVVIGTPSGLKAQEAQAELNRRLIEKMEALVTSLDKNNETTERFNRRTLQLTWAMAVLAVVQIVIPFLRN